MSNQTKYSYSHGAITMPLLGRTMGQILDDTVARFPDREAAVFSAQGIRRTYTQFRQDVDEVARGLYALGIRKGERVGMWATNWYEWALVQFATARLGAIQVNINPAYRSFELEYALKKSEVRTLIMIPTFKTSNYVEMINQACPALAGCHAGVIQADNLPFLREVIVISEERYPGTLRWRDVLAGGRSILQATIDECGRDLEFDEPINIQYTSGTTGFPKGVMLSHHNVINNAQFVGLAQRITEQDRICIPVPFYHCFGMVMSITVAVLYGAAMVVPAEAFDPLAVLKAVHQEHCTTLQGVPTMFLAELEHPAFAQYDMSSLRTGIMAGSPCPIELAKRAIEQMHMSEFTIAYGMTELSPVVTQTTWDDAPEMRATTVGRPGPHCEIKIVDPNTGKIVPIGQQGEICSRGYSTMLGYYKDPEATAKTIDGARWLHTGDLGTMDERGYVKVTGRIKDMVIRGGENIYPREIEEFLYTHPKISDVQCFGVPDVKYGEVLAAWIRLKSGCEATPEEIQAFCEGKIAHFKVPRYVEFVDAFPMTVTGKIQKFKMREAVVERLGLTAASKIETA